MTFRLKPLGALMAGVCTASPLALADEQAALPTVNVSATADQPATSRDYQPLTSSVGGKTAAAVADIPQTVTVVNKALMQAQGATSLADALRNVPGITLGGAEGGQIGNNINLRGFTARTDIYIDGFRDRGQYYRDTFAVDQVEVLQGPSSMLFGRGSTGGVINQVTRKPGLDDLTEVSGTLGTDDRLRTTYDSNRRISDTAAVRVNVFAQNQKTTRDVMENKDFGVAPSIRFGIGEPTEVTLSALVQHNNDMPDYGVQALNGTPVTPSRNTFYGEKTDHTDQNIAMFNATVQHRFNDNLTLRNQVQVNRYTTNALETTAQSLATRSGNTFTPVVPGNSYAPGDLWVHMQSHDRNITDTSVDNQTDLISKFTTGVVRHELVTGIEAGRDTYRNQSLSRTGSGQASGYLNWVPLMNPDSSTPTPVTATVGNLATSSANSLGLYFNDTLSLGEQWKIVAGLRNDSFHGQINNTISAPLGQTKQNSNFTSRRAGVIYQPDTQQSYYASYGTSFNPLLEQMTLSNGTQSLPPTNTRSHEIGGKWTVAGMSLAVAAFNTLQSNVYTRATSADPYVPAGNWLIKGYTLSAAGRVTDRLQLSSGFMHLVPRVVNTLDATNGTTPSNTPKDTLTLWTSYDLSPHWEAGAGANYMSRRYAGAASATNVNAIRTAVPGYTRYDATVAYHRSRYEIRVNVLNLTNKYYYDALIQSDGGRAVPGIGRTGLLTVTYRFK